MLPLALILAGAGAAGVGSYFANRPGNWDVEYKKLLAELEAMQTSATKREGNSLMSGLAREAYGSFGTGGPTNPGMSERINEAGTQIADRIAQLHANVALKVADINQTKSAQERAAITGGISTGLSVGGAIAGFAAPNLAGVDGTPTPTGAPPLAPLDAGAGPDVSMGGASVGGTRQFSVPTPPGGPSISPPSITGFSTAQRFEGAEKLGLLGKGVGDAFTGQGLGDFYSGLANMEPDDLKGLKDQLAQMIAELRNTPTY